MAKYGWEIGDERVGQADSTQKGLWKFIEAL